MDEPFAALDEQTRLLLGDKVLQIQQELKQTTLAHHPQHHRGGAALRPHPGDDLSARQGEAHRWRSICRARAPPRSSRARRSGATWRRSGAICARRRAAACGGRGEVRCRAAHHHEHRVCGRSTKTRWFPIVARVGIVLPASSSWSRCLIRIGLINRFIVPMPSEIFMAFPRVVIGGERAAALLLTPPRGVLGEHPGEPSSASRRRAAATRSACCGRRPRPGWRRSRRRRWC